MDFDPRLKREESNDLLDDDQICENLDEHMEEDLLDEEDEALEDDPWEQQVRMDKKQSETQYSVW